ncbi:MAG: single-stranded DNA-binding protein [Clostridia bacterium]|nr:single-stranded DNA-binding protein [Clostridia bacterium]
MNYELLLNNNVQLWGKVIKEPTYSHSVIDEKFYEFLLEVPRLSDSSDIIPITISEKLFTKEDLKMNNVIALNGQFRSYNKLIENKSKLMLTVFVRELTEVDTTKNPNIIELKGFLCKEPIFRTTPFKREITDILVAINRAYNKSDYIPCIAWGRNARFVKNLEVGTKLEIGGRIQSRVYQKKIDEDNVVNKTAYEISISKVNIIEKEPITTFELEKLKQTITD